MTTRLKLLCLPVVLIATLFTYAWYPSAKLPAGVSVDSIVVLKSQRQLLAYSNGELLKTYTIALGKQPAGAKQCEGDNKTPEGIYHINAKNAKSLFHKNLGISYPGSTDLANAALIGKPAGGDIKIHGLQNGLGCIGRLHTLKDWTDGCIALTNDEADDLYTHVVVGTVVLIRP